VTLLALVLALLGSAALLAGVALWSVPAALVLAGVLLLAAAYGLAYADRRRAA
jgi:uncharacterized membrane protein